MSRAPQGGGPPCHASSENKALDQSTPPAFLAPQPVSQPTPEPPAATAGLKLASNGGHGTLEALRVSQILDDRGIPCCFCGVSALIYYGAGRVRDVSTSFFLFLFVFFFFFFLSLFLVWALRPRIPLLISVSLLPPLLLPTNPGLGIVRTVGLVSTGRVRAEIRTPFTRVYQRRTARPLPARLPDTHVSSFPEPRDCLLLRPGAVLRHTPRRRRPVRPAEEPQRPSLPKVARADPELPRHVRRGLPVRRCRRERRVGGMGRPEPGPGGY